MLTNISGYIEEEYICNPFICAQKELSEEFLPVTDCKENSFRIFQFNYFGLFSNPHFHEYAGVISLEKNTHFPMLDRKIIYIDNKPVEGEPEITFHTPTNNAQLLFSFHIDIPSQIEAIYYTKDIFTPETGFIKTILSYRGIVFAKLFQEKLTGELYELKNGVMNRVDPRKKSFSEYFTQSEGDIFTQKEIGFEEYVKGQ